MKRTAIIFLLVPVAASLFTRQSDFSKLTGPYLGQKPPGLVPEIFAPGILSRFSMLHGKIVISPDGLEAFWTCNAAPVQSRWTARQTPQGIWTAPEQSFFSIEYVENSMCYSADGKRLYFHSRRPLQGTGAPKDKDIWYRKKTPEGWGDPVPLGPPVNMPTSDESAPSLAADGTLFFTRQESTGAHGSPGQGASPIDIYYAEWRNGSYAEPVRMGPEINSDYPEIDPVIAPDKSYLLFTSARPDGYSRMMNLYVSFRTADGRWTPAQSLSHTLKVDNIWFPSLIPDGAYLFFCGGYPTEKGYTDSRYYWISTKVIDGLRAKEPTSLSRQQNDFPKLTGPYLGQKPPGMIPEIFAPGIVSLKDHIESGCTWSPDLKEFYFARSETSELISNFAIWCIQEKDGLWNEPQVVPFSGVYRDFYPFIPPDGKCMIFIRRDSNEKKTRIGSWIVDRKGSSWSEPRFFHDAHELTTNDFRTFYFATERSKETSVDIGRIEFDNGVFSAPVKLSSELNTPEFEAHARLSPDGSYMLFDRGKSTFVSFLRDDETWSRGYDLGRKCNLPAVSPDGKYIFFESHGDIYWVDARIIEELRQKEARGDAQDILKATQKGDVKAVKTILSANPSLARTTDKWGRTPLHYAVDINSAEIMECLIGCGADLEATDMYAWTPLFRAIDKGKKEAVKRLIQRGTNIHHGMEDGFKPVHLAASVGNADLLELLLRKGADSNARNRYDLTPLHIAAAYGFSDVVEHLLSHNADMNAKSIDGGIPIHFAQAGGNPDIADLMKSKGADVRSRKRPPFQGAYLGFREAGLKPEIFLPGIIIHLNPPHNGLTISPDSKQIWWTETSIKYDLYSRIWLMKEVDGFWTPPQVAPFSSRYLDSYPCFSVDGKMIFFSSNRPLDENTEPKDSNIWYVEKTKEGWSRPKSLGPSVNTEMDENTPTVDKDGTLYYSRAEVVEGKFDVNVYRSRYLNGQYVESEKLEDTINSPTPDVYPFIAPDGSYLIYNTSRYGIGFQLCISFLKEDGSWTEAKPMKELLGAFISWCQGISPDGQYLFFAGHKNGVWDIYWMDAKIIEDLKPKELKDRSKP